jgi:hypothetical protein
MKTCKLCNLFGFPEDTIKPLLAMIDKAGKLLPDSFCCKCTSGKVIAICEHLHGIWG